MGFFSHFFTLAGGVYLGYSIGQKSTRFEEYVNVDTDSFVKYTGNSLRLGQFPIYKYDQTNGTLSLADILDLKIKTENKSKE